LDHEIALGREITLRLEWTDALPASVDQGHRTASGALEIRLSPAGGQFHATRSVQVEAAALLDFAESLSRLLDDLTGSATLEPVLGYGGHGNFALTVNLEHGKGDVAGFLAAHHHDARLTFGGVEIDQSYVQETHHQLRSLLADR